MCLYYDFETWEIEIHRLDFPSKSAYLVYDIPYNFIKNFKHKIWKASRHER